MNDAEQILNVINEYKAERRKHYSDCTNPPSRPDRSDTELESGNRHTSKPALIDLGPARSDRFTAALLDWVGSDCPEEGWKHLMALQDDAGAPPWLKGGSLGLDALSHQVLALALGTSIQAQQGISDAQPNAQDELSLQQAVRLLKVEPPVGLARLAECLKPDGLLLQMGYLKVDERISRRNRQSSEPINLDQFLRTRFSLNLHCLSHLLGLTPAEVLNTPDRKRLEDLALSEDVRATIGRLLEHPEVIRQRFRMLIRGPQHFGGRALAQAIANHLEQPLREIQTWDGPQPGCVVLIHVQPGFDQDDFENIQKHPGLTIFRMGQRETRYELEAKCDLAVDLGELNLADMILFANRELRKAGPLFQHCNPIDTVGRQAMSPGALVEAIRRIRSEAEWQGHNPDTVPNLLIQAVRRVQKGGSDFSQETTPRLTMADLSLDREHMSRFLRIIQSIRGRQALLDRWHLDPNLVGRTKAVLFHGPSGTGKSLAGEVLAHELGLPLKRVEASSLESPYVGESEQKLHRFFQEGRKGNPCVLLLDEADSMLGNRASATGSTTRYQISLVNAWLRELDEGMDSILVFTTNFGSNFDPALERRIQFRLGFVEPGPTVRQNIWNNLFARAPVPGADTLNIQKLAQDFDLSGGRIRNAFLAALEMAATEGSITQQIVRDACLEEVKSSLPKNEGPSRRIAGFGANNN